MAETQEDRSRDDLTEEASPHRLEEYRSKGMVAQSKEVSTLFALLAASLVVYKFAPQFGIQTGEWIREIFRSDFSSKGLLNSDQLSKDLFSKVISLLLSILLPVFFASFVMGVLGSYIQIGNIFSFEPLTPDLSKLDPLQGLRRFISLKKLIESVRLIIKISIVLCISYFLIKSEVLSSFSYSGVELYSLLSHYKRIASEIFMSLFGILCVFAGIDLYFQRHEYLKNLKMTKQEAKQEHKEREGDPHIRARIRSIQREMAKKRMMHAVKKADVVITNPTHIAIALVYEQSRMNSPKVIAKGADLIAEKIKMIAKESGVPLVENVPLARTLFKSVKIGQNIPKSLYQAVAEVLAYVYRLRRK